MAISFQQTMESTLPGRTGAAAKMAHAVTWVQALYYLVTGVWPLVSIRSFQAVTGRKTDHLVTGSESDHWLVMTVGVLIVAIALSLLAAAARNRIAFETVVLANAAAIGLLLIDVIYVARGAIAPIYLADAVAEVLLLGGWCISICGTKRGAQ